MKLSEQFVIEEEPARLWKTLQQTELVASCMPGVESVEVLDPDNIKVRVSHAIGPMSATFDARVRVLQRIDGQLIRFEALGKSIRGAVGSVRASNSVTLCAVQSGTLVMLDGDLALAGALGSVGQKIVAKQANRVTAEFAQNLRQVLAGEAPMPAAPAGRAIASQRSPIAAGASTTGGAAPSRSTERWAQASFVMSAVSAGLSILMLIRMRRAHR